MENSLNFLSTRNGFNTALRHFKGVTSLVKLIESKKNLADIINSKLEDKKIESFQIGAIISALLIDKYEYYACSFNLKSSSKMALSEIGKIVKNWTAFDIIMAYYHPQLGMILINPKSEESWANVDCLKEYELVVLYVGNYNCSFDRKVAQKCAEELEKLLNSEITNSTMKFSIEASMPVKKVEPQKSEPAKLDAVKVADKKQVQPAPAQAPSSGKKKMSPQYGVTVSNELFHNGNVEAWKKIIRSYETKYSGTKVLIFYEGEQIHDINTLFKWGKVKHGTNIYISLLGSEFNDISKLRRYLAQGASSRFEDFNKGDPTKDLALF